MIKTFKPQVLTIGLSLLLLSISFGMSKATAETKDKEDVKWGKPTEDVVCAVTLQQSSIEHSADQPILVNLHTKNNNSKQIGFTRTDVLKMFKFHVVGPNKKRVPLTLSGKSGSLQISGAGISLKPRATYHYGTTLRLNDYFDMSLPGIYQVSFKKKIYILGREDWLTMTSNTLRIKVIEPSQESPVESKLDIKWGKSVGNIACAASTSVNGNLFNLTVPIWINLHTQTSKGQQKKVSLEGEYEISVLSPLSPHKMLHPIIIYIKGKLNPVPLTLYGLQQTLSKNKSTLHIKLNPKDKEDFVRLHLNRYFDMTLFPEDGYQVSFKRKLKLPKQNKTVRVQSNKLIIKNTGDVKPEKKKTDLN